MAITNYGNILKADGDFLAFAGDIAYKVTLETDEFSGETEYTMSKSIKDAIDEIDEINVTALTDLNDRLSTMETALDNVLISDEDITGVSVLALSNKITEVETKVDSVFVELTQAEYDALETKQSGVLYLIKEEENATNND